MVSNNKTSPTPTTDASSKTLGLREVGMNSVDDSLAVGVFCGTIGLGAMITFENCCL